MVEIIYFISCLLQPICLPLPETVTVMAGAELLGANQAFLLGVTGIMIGIALIFSLTRYSNLCILKKLRESKAIVKYKHYVEQHEFLITGMLFILPILPDEIICVGAAMIGIHLTTLLGIALFAKIISVGSIAYAGVFGQYLSLSRYEVILLELVFLFGCSYFMRRWKEKKENS